VTFQAKNFPVGSFAKANKSVFPASPQESRLGVRFQAKGLKMSFSTTCQRLSAHEWRFCVLVNARTHGTRWMPFFGFLSRLGDGWVWYALIACCALFGGPTGARASLHLAVVGLVSLALYKIIKQLSQRPRPLARHTGLHLSVAPLDEFSFPSGHTLHAVAFSLVCSHYFPWMALLLVPLSAGIAASRVALGLHYPSDVIAAIVLGVGLFWLTSAWL
jgi:undecaprenyl-diphosphatase